MSLCWKAYLATVPEAVGNLGDASRQLVLSMENLLFSIYQSIYESKFCNPYLKYSNNT